jgi:outer membrane immunogenic protein
MKKLALALAVAIFSGSALAADLPVRTYSKAPAMIEPTPSWTGFYVFGGFGGGLWDAKESLVTSAGVPLQRDETTGDSITFKPIVQTISSSLVYRFNWTGAPVVAKY